MILPIFKMIMSYSRYKGPFILKISPNRWSCVPASFATCLNISIEEIINEIGHDGSNIIFPHMSEPLCRRGFHLQELYKVCYNHGYAVTHFDIQPQLIGNGEMYNVKTDKDFIDKILLNNIGVLGGYFKGGITPHCVCWDGSYIIDPSQEIFYSIEHFNIQSFYLISKIQF